MISNVQIFTKEKIYDKKGILLSDCNWIVKVVANCARVQDIDTKIYEQREFDTSRNFKNIYIDFNKLEFDITQKIELYDYILIDNVYYAKIITKKMYNILNKCCKIRLTVENIEPRECPRVDELCKQHSLMTVLGSGDDILVKL